MEDLRQVIGKNLSELRKRKGLTQFELAEIFNYTDRAISKWENGDTLPDVEVLYNLCEFYGVTIDYLTHEENAQFTKRTDPLNTWNKVAITALVSSVVWMLATVIFVFTMLRGIKPFWQVFVWAVPLNAVLVVFFNRSYFHKRLIVFIAWSVFIWSVLAGTFLTVQDANLWPIFLLGVPTQAAMLIWLNLKLPEKKRNDVKK